MKETVMRTWIGYLYAAFAVLAASSVAHAQTPPAYQALRAAELMVPPGSAGTDYSGNPPSTTGLTLRATIPDAITKPRRGYVIQAQCTAGLLVVFDSVAGGTATAVVVSGGASAGAQGGALDMTAMPHTGRIQIYSSDPTCQYGARVWE